MSHFWKYMGKYMSKILFSLFILGHLHCEDRRRENKKFLGGGASYTYLKSILRILIWLFRMEQWKFQNQKMISRISQQQRWVLNRVILFFWQLEKWMEWKLSWPENSRSKATCHSLWNFKNTFKTLLNYYLWFLNLFCLTLELLTDTWCL